MKGHMASVDSVALEGLVVSGDSDVLSGLVAMAVCWPETGPCMHCGLPGSVVGYLEGLRMGHSRRWCGSQAAAVTDASIQSPFIASDLLLTLG